MDPNLGRLRGGFWLRRGALRLVPGADGDRETFAISTSLQELLNHDEGIGPVRPQEEAMPSVVDLRRETGLKGVKDS